MKIKHYIKKFGNIKCIDPHNFLQFDDFSQDLLHLKPSRKAFLIKRVAYKIFGKFDNIMPQKQPVSSAHMNKARYDQPNHRRNRTFAKQNSSPLYRSQNDNRGQYGHHTHHPLPTDRRANPPSMLTQNSHQPISNNNMPPQHIPAKAPHIGYFPPWTPLPHIPPLQQFGVEPNPQNIFPYHLPQSNFSVPTPVPYLGFKPPQHPTRDQSFLQAMTSLVR